MSPDSSSIHIIPIRILSSVQASVCLSTSLSRFLSLFHHFPTGTLLLHHIHECHPSPSCSLFSISVALKQHMFFCFDLTTPTTVIIMPPCHPFAPSYRSTCSSHHQSYSSTKLPSAKLSFLGHIFIFTYPFSFFVLLNPFFHASLPTFCILSQLYFFHTFLSTFISRLTIPFTSINNIRLTNFISPNLAHHLSFKHALPIPGIKLSSNTRRNIHSTTIPFASLSLFKSIPTRLSSDLFVSNIFHFSKPSIHSFPSYFQLNTYFLIQC